MDKHTKKTPSLFRYPVLVAFGLFFIGLFVLDMATPDRAYSELEDVYKRQEPGQPAGPDCRRGEGHAGRPADDPCEPHQ